MATTLDFVALLASDPVPGGCLQGLGAGFGRQTWAYQAVDLGCDLDSGLLRPSF